MPLTLRVRDIPTAAVCQKSLRNPSRYSLLYYFQTSGQDYEMKHFKYNLNSYVTGGETVLSQLDMDEKLIHSPYAVNILIFFH